MRTPSLPVLPPASPFKHPQNALKPASHAVFGPFLVPSPPHPFKRPSNGVQTPFKPASVKRLQADVAFRAKKRALAGPKRKADVKQTSSSWTIRFAPLFLYLPISQPFPPFLFGHFVLRAPNTVASLTKNFLAFATPLQVPRKTFWRLREPRKCLGKLFGVCGSPASPTKNFLAFAGAPQVPREMLWCLRECCKHFQKRFGHGVASVETADSILTPDPTFRR